MNLKATREGRQMKAIKLTTLCILLAVSALSSAQPSTGGPSFEELNVSGMLTVGGSVGVGTTNPQAKLEVSGDFIQINGAAGEKVHIGGDGFPARGSIPDVEIGSVNPQVVDVSLWNPVAGVFMNLFVNDLYARGTKQFIQPYPTDPSKFIAYTSLEGPEAGTYIRGTTELVNGEAVIELPKHFSLVTSEEGLTVQLTPLGEWLQLYVVERSTTKIVVREANGKDGRFDYLVQGVRKGYEGYQVVRERK